MNRFGPHWRKFFGERWKTVTDKYPRAEEAKRTAIEFVGIYAAVYLFTTNVVGFTVCVGPSMLPTIDEDGELALIDRFSYRIRKEDYQVGDVVISRSVDDPKKTVCKRVRATAGTAIYYTDKRGLPVIAKVPDDHVWLLGDNPANSNDSRYYGPVPLKNLQGRVFWKIGKNPLHCCPVDQIVVKEKDEDDQ